MSEQLHHCDGTCGGDYPEEFFRKDPDGYIRPVCIGCERTKRDEAKRENRFPDKAQGTIDRHALRYIKAGVVRSKREFVTRFGWRAKRIAHEMEHAYANGCPLCGEPFHEMGHGLADITVDIHHPDEAPYYGHNTRLICQGCNRDKSNTPPAVFAVRQACWPVWKENIRRRKTNPLHGLPLFSAPSADIWELCE